METRTEYVFTVPTIPAIVSWDAYTKVEKWQGTVEGLEGDGLLRFERADGKLFHINRGAARLMYIEVVEDAHEC